MKMRLLASILALTLLAACTAAAQNTLTLSRTTMRSEVNGVIGDGETKIDAPAQCAMREVDGKTTLEVALESSQFIGQ